MCVEQHTYLLLYNNYFRSYFSLRILCLHKKIKIVDWRKGDMAFRILLSFSLIWCIFKAHASTDCMPRVTKFGLVCVCSESYCDYLENPQPTGDSVVVVSSSKKGERFAVRNLHFGENNKNLNSESNPNNGIFGGSAVIVDRGLSFLHIITNGAEHLASRLGFKTPINLSVNRSIEYQNITGFGGAVTGTVSYLLGLLDPQLQDHIYKSYYHKDGIGFNLLRTPIGGCDFDLAPWAYNEQPINDEKLSNFTKLDPRDEVKVQQIQRLKNLSNIKDLKIMAAAWSPPTWMKSNGNWTGTSHLKTNYYQTWADYHLRFIELMDAKNLPIWAISTGNEPLDGVLFQAFIHFMSLGWLPQTQAIWLNDFLGPTIRKSKYKNVLIFGNEDQRPTFPTWFTEMNLARPGATDYLNGLAVHWYWDEIFSPSLIDSTVKQFPGKIVLNTEASIGDKPWQTHGPELGSWDRGEMYALDILHNLQHSYNGWMDWNIILDEQGGPNYVKNYVDSAVIVNTTNRAEIYKQPMFYAMGHFSKFLPEGSVRIEAKLQSTLVEAIAFKRPDGRIVVILLNSDSEDVDVVLNDSVHGKLNINVPAKSWHTIIYN